MTCRWVKKQGWAYLEDSLPLGQKANLEAHLQACAHCRAELMRRAETIDRLTKGLPVEATPQQGSGLLATVALLALLIVAGLYGFSLFVKSPPSEPLVAAPAISLEPVGAVSSSRPRTIEPRMAANPRNAPPVSSPASRPAPRPAPKPQPTFAIYDESGRLIKQEPIKP